MRCVFLAAITTLTSLLNGCSYPLADTHTVKENEISSQSSIDSSSDLDSAQQTLISFFDSLAQHDFKLASELHHAPNPLMFLYPDIDPENSEALLSRACSDKDRFGCRFYCWKIKDVVNRAQASSNEFIFTVRFEDETGNLLIGGDNVTPRACDPPGCEPSEYAYTVIKADSKFYVDGIPVFSGCWP